GAGNVPETISDTGPILHLGEIGRLTVLAPLSPIKIPNLVSVELSARGIEEPVLRSAGIEASVESLDTTDWQRLLRGLGPIECEPADAQVVALVRSSGFQALSLTDDLTLRRLLEGHGATVVGTVGLLVRAYSAGRLQRAQLEESVEALFNDSTL